MSDHVAACPWPATPDGHTPPLQASLKGVDHPDIIGTVTHQACDDKVRFSTATGPLLTMVQLKALDRERVGGR